MVFGLGTDDWSDETGPLAGSVPDDAATDVEGRVLEMLEEAPSDLVPVGVGLAVLILEDVEFEEMALERAADDGKPEISTSFDDVAEEAKLEENESGAELLDDGSGPLIDESDAELTKDKDAEDVEFQELVDDDRIDESEFVTGYEDDGPPTDVGLDSDMLVLALVEDSADDPRVAGLELVGGLPGNETFHDGALEDDRLDEGRVCKLDDEDFVCLENGDVDAVNVDGGG